VTRKLFERGWSGVNVDANNKLLEAFRNARPLDVALNVAVGNQPSYELTVFNESAISTVNAEWKERFLEERNSVSSTINVPGRTLRSILDEFFPNNGPDFLNIDIEGADFIALKSGEFESLQSGRIPKYILIENPNPSDPSEQGEIGSYLESLKYVRLYVLPYSSLYKFSG
jgi:FkbM family methyltransferase